MFKLFGKLCFLVCIVAATVLSYPYWRPALVRAVPQLQSVLPTETQETPVTVRSSAPGPAPTLVIPLTPTPSPSPTAARAVPWSAADCTWAEATMATDAHLDQQEAWAIAEGFDSRYPLSAEATYVAWEQDWRMVGTQLSSMCSTGVAVSADHIAQAQADFSAAVSSHQEDMAATPADTTWDQTWIANYTRIAAMYSALS